MSKYPEFYEVMRELKKIRGEKKESTAESKRLAEIARIDLMKFMSHERRLLHENKQNAVNDR